jgi:hypothetical protein
VKHRAFRAGWGTLFMRFGGDLGPLTQNDGPLGRSARAGPPIFTNFPN